MEQQLNEKIKRYIQDVKEAIYEPTIERELPSIPLVLEEEAFFILLPFFNGERETKERYREAVAIGAVFSALRAHSRVHLENSSSTEQQLTVLAGDHFSGIHYRILASLRSFPLIRHLSEAIARANEEKTDLFFRQLSTSTDWKKSIITSDVGLITSFYDVNGWQHYHRLVQDGLPYSYIKNESAFTRMSPTIVEEARIQWKKELVATIDQNEANLTEALQQYVRRRAVGK